MHAIHDFACFAMLVFVSGACGNAPPNTSRNVPGDSSLGGAPEMKEVWAETARNAPAPAPNPPNDVVDPVIDKIFLECPEGREYISGMFIYQIRDFSTYSRQQALTEAEKLNGVEYSAEITARYSARRWYNPTFGGWSQWEEPPGPAVVLARRVNGTIEYQVVGSGENWKKLDQYELTRCD